jgi:hypothetical protein
MKLFLIALVVAVILIQPVLILFFGMVFVILFIAALVIDIIMGTTCWWMDVYEEWREEKKVDQRNIQERHKDHWESYRTDG